MLDQIGENVFFGPCASCPCMKSNSVEQTIEEIGEDMNVAERFEQGLHKTVEDKIPVDIVMSIGGKVCVYSIHACIFQVYMFLTEV